MATFDNIEAYYQNVRNFSHYSKSLVTFTTSVGAALVIYLVGKFLYHLIQGFRLYFFSQLQSRTTNYVERYGKWAVVTGGTDGIGLAIAKDLARRGHSILLVARNQSKLDDCKSQIEAIGNVGRVKTVKIDLADSSVANFELAISKIDPDNRDIGVLVNNAGTFPDQLTRLHNNDIEYLRTIMNVNMLAVVYFSRYVLPGMIKRRRGLILNVSSLLGLAPVPTMSVYGPTKTFVDRFSHQMRLEYANYPIDVINLTPGRVNTKLLLAAADPSSLSPDADQYARSAMNAISARVSPTSGTAFHGFISMLFGLLESFGLLIVALTASLSEYNNINLTPKMKRKIISGAVAPETS